MKKLPVTFLLLAAAGWSFAQNPSGLVHLKDAVKDFPRSELQIKSAGRLSIDTSEGARASYEKAARAAGLNIIFDADFRDTFSVPPQIVNADILDALDLLSTASGSFVEMLNRDTIIVSPDNPTKRRDYELMVLKTFYLRNATPQALTEAITGLRTRLGVRYIAMGLSSGAIVIRDTPARIALAEESLAGAGRIRAGIPVATNAAGHLFIDEGGSVRQLTPARAALRFTAAATPSLEISGDSRATFESLAKAAGLNIIFDPDFRSSTIKPFKIDNAGILDALDLVSIQVRSFWEPLDARTILVSPDNQTKRRDHDLLTVKVFHFSSAVSQRDLIEVTTALRTLLNCRYLALVNGANAIAIRDNPTRMALAERVIRDLAEPGSVTVSEEISAGTEGSLILSRRVARARDAAPSELKPRTAGPFSFAMNNGTRASFEALAATSGLRIVFDSRFLDSSAIPFKLENADILDALDLLSIQTGNLWESQGPDTIIVAPDNPTVRRDLSRQSTKTISLPASASGSIAEIVTALRTLLNMSHVDAMGNAIIVQDRPDTVGLAEKVVAELLPGR